MILGIFGGQYVKGEGQYDLKIHLISVQCYLDIFSPVSSTTKRMTDIALKDTSTFWGRGDGDL